MPLARYPESDMPRKPSPTARAARQQVNVRLLADTAERLRGAAALLRRDLGDIVEECLAPHLARLEKSSGLVFPLLPPKPSPRRTKE